MLDIREVIDMELEQAVAKALLYVNTRKELNQVTQLTLTILGLEHKYLPGQGNEVAYRLIRNAKAKRVAEMLRETEESLA